MTGTSRGSILLESAIIDVLKHGRGLLNTKKHNNS